MSSPRPAGHRGRTSSRRPGPDEIPAGGLQALVDTVEGDCVLQVLRDQAFWICELASSLSAEQVDRVHPPYQWSVRQVIEHVADAERVNGYRMMRFAAGDPTELSGWDENAFADARFGLGNLHHLITELGALRQANVALLQRLTPSAWDRTGTADGNRLSVRGIAWIAAGHLQHHWSILEKRCEIQVQRAPMREGPTK